MESVNKRVPCLLFIMKHPHNLKAAHFAEQCLGTLGVGSKAGAGMPENLEFQPLVAGLGRALGGKLAEGRTAARRGLLRCGSFRVLY